MKTLHLSEVQCSNTVTCSLLKSSPYTYVNCVADIAFFIFTFFFVEKLKMLYVRYLIQNIEFISFHFIELLCVQQTLSHLLTDPSDNDI